MISIVAFKWTPHPNYRSKFGPETVNTLFAMLRRHYATPFRAVCVTDDHRGIDSSIDIVPLWPDFGNMLSPHGSSRPSCYRRLKMFGPDAGALFGPRFAIMDLDCVITGDVTPIFDRPEEFIMWGETHPRTFYNGSLMLMNAGARRQVWDRFDPRTSPRKAQRAGHYGSDQGWISYCLGPKEAKFTTKDGVYSYRIHLSQSTALPSNCRLIFWNGRLDPWSPEVQHLPWVKEFYRMDSKVAV
jgi:hypothetical protein